MPSPGSRGRRPRRARRVPRWQLGHTTSFACISCCQGGRRCYRGAVSPQIAVNTAVTRDDCSTSSTSGTSYTQTQWGMRRGVLPPGMIGGRLGLDESSRARDADARHRQALTHRSRASHAVIGADIAAPGSGVRSGRQRDRRATTADEPCNSVYAHWSRRSDAMSAARPWPSETRRGLHAKIAEISSASVSRRGVAFRTTRPRRRELRVYVAIARSDDLTVVEMTNRQSRTSSPRE